MDNIFETRDLLPIKALPDFLRGISQFGKTGILSFSSERREGYISFHEGKMMAICFTDRPFAEDFLSRLYRGGAIPSNVFNVLSEQVESLSVKEIIEVLHVHEYLSGEEISRYYQAGIQEVLFELLEMKDGNISFRLERWPSFVPGENDCSMLPEDSGGIYPCQFLLDYVESGLLAEALCEEGEYLQLIEYEEESGIFLEPDEKRMLKLARAEYSVCQVLEAVCDTRKSVFELLLHLRDSGVIACGAGKSGMEAPLDEPETGQPADEQEPVQTEARKRTWFEQGNMYFMKPGGIEWVVGIFLPVMIVSVLYYFQKIVHLTLGEFNIIFRM